MLSAVYTTVSNTMCMSLKMNEWMNINKINEWTNKWINNWKSDKTVDSNKEK